MIASETVRYYEINYTNSELSPFGWSFAKVVTDTNYYYLTKAMYNASTVYRRTYNVGLVLL